MLEQILVLLPQVLFDGFILGFIYAMIALGYTMVYGVLELINFAHSEIFMIGAVAGVEVFRYLAPLIPNGYLLLLVAVVVGAAVAGLTAILVERMAYRPLRRRGTTNRLVPLVTAIGVSFFLQDLVRLIEGLWHNEFFLRMRTIPDLEGSFTLFGGAIFIQTKSVIVIVVSVLMLWGLTYLVNRTKLGMAIRAVAQDLSTASLMGINPDLIISRTFLIGGALGGVAGVLFALIYTTINPYVGFLPGIKAFTAAVLGGIGNIPGAMLGGLVLGQLENFFGTYLPILTAGNFGTEYKDVVAFLILIFILLFRPQGLLGQMVKEKV
ncbi:MULTISPECIES: branched-chain amino acid ABC transporter permease [Thermus]|uniref:Branched-chain amino acid ABC transporter, permease protein n=1 Tax=Thermus thermophilus (strain ATCC 27634 / DSM 579 / HB8) TaxID=300852 RepID=Q5SIN8_THET8|nr:MULTISPECIES: branched-chain amino acid ABC transporter permease [Thermus]QZY57924.1 branched-chain amino acid ABC transporter permease [Thermus thermophilus]BAD71154.1 branched-chain amino acid ABC transporter, permease protein [Thermus thermophilus HB8]BDA37948.1 branched-chain amino acid ABC transporter permease [Thermus thermophilus]BDE45673.1 branched-chain amino acid ABC transporter permease [Thermus thermophilus]HAH40029.1 branched-chain amino acid ABC transporter permease [Thermus s